MRENNKREREKEREREREYCIQKEKKIMKTKTNSICLLVKQIE